MRLTGWSVVGAALTAPVLLLSCSQSGNTGPDSQRGESPGLLQASFSATGPNIRQVELRVGCSGNSVYFALSPWYRNAKVGDAIEWHLTVTAGQVSEFGIKPVNDRWPFTYTGLISGSSRVPARAAGMVEGASGSYHYVVELFCDDAVTGRRHKMVIDPEVDIESGG